MPARLLLRTCLGLVLLTAAELASAAVYRWVDDKGRVHYGDQPPPQTGAKALSTGPAKATKPVEPPPRASTECEERRKQLARYREAGQIKETNALGEERSYTDAQRSELIRLTEQKMQQACAEPTP